MKLRWGILGTGNIAAQFARGVSASRRGTLAAVASRDATKAQSFATRFSIPLATDYDALLRREDLDAVYVSLPNSMHHRWTIAALDAGKHVLCEKPLAVSEAEAREMFAAASRNGRVLIEAYMYRAHPQTAAVMAAIGRGAIGEVRHVRTNFCFKVARPQGNIRFDPALAGGALMDVGGYCLSFAMLIAGGLPVTASAAARLHATGVDEQTAGLLQFANGITSTFTVGMGLQSDNAATISGTDGYLAIDWPWKPSAGKSGYTLAGQTPPRQDNPTASPVAPPPQKIDVPVDDDLYAIEADAFAAVLAGEREPFMSVEESIGLAGLMRSIREQIGLTY